MKKCNHDLKDKNCSLKKHEKRTMLFPPEVYLTCSICDKDFKLIKNNNNDILEEIIE